MKQKFGKNSNGILAYQEYLIASIDDHISNEQKYAYRFSKSKVRENCIVCDTNIENVDFVRNTIKFSFCNSCGHLNGHNILDESLAAEIYNEQSDTEIKYDKYYIQEKEEFDKAVKNIYEPKSIFLSESLQEYAPKEDSLRLRILDFGTGSGHMVRALRNIGFQNVLGIDPMKSTIDFGLNQMNVENLKCIPTSASEEYLFNTNAQIITMICTLPHVPDPNLILNAMKLNPNIEYTFQKLPMFSLGSILDIAHPEINSRVISGTHTHIYTEESLKFIEKKFELERVAEWRFGSDIIDLYRNLEIVIQKKNFSKKLSKKLAEAFLPIIDELQLKIDQNYFASEIHVLWKFVRKN